MKKVLIVIGDAGAGHLSCANATRNAIKKLDSTISVEIIDIFQFSKMSRLYNFVQYLVSGSKLIEFLFNTSFTLINKSRFCSELAYFFTLSPIAKPTLKYLREYSPDLVISNNALTTEVLSRCKKEYSFKYVITVPDLVTMVRWWASSEADLIFSPTKKATEELLSFNPNCNILTGYYPLRDIKEFSEEEIDDFRKIFCKEHDFEFERDIILITGCGVSTAGLVRRLRSFILNTNYQLIILTGKDIKLKSRLEKRFQSNKRVYISGYTNEILKLFVISDLIISKTGPATVLEIEKVNKKAIFTEPPVIQEFGNVEYIKDNPNFSYIGANYEQLPELVEQMLVKDTIKHQSEIKDANSIANIILKL